MLALKFAGISSIVLGVIHFPLVWHLIFTDWVKDIQKLNPLNRKLVYTVLNALGLTLMVLGMATLGYTRDAEVHGISSQWFSVLCMLFWLWRTAWQIVSFPVKKLALDRRLFTLHISLIVIFSINFLAYLFASIRSV